VRIDERELRDDSRELDVLVQIEVGDAVVRRSAGRDREARHSGRREIEAATHAITPRTQDVRGLV